MQDEDDIEPEAPLAPPLPDLDALPPEGEEKRPRWWPEQIPFRGIMPAPERYKEIDDPAYAHLTRYSTNPAKARKGVRVFKPGLHPKSWQGSNSPLQRVRQAQERAASADDRGDTGESASPRGSERELEARQLYRRSLSRAFAETAPDDLRKVTKKIVELAGKGEKEMITLLVSLERLNASEPLTDDASIAEELESVRAAREAINQLVRKARARMTHGECPWCGHLPEADEDAELEPVH